MYARTELYRWLAGRVPDATGAEMNVHAEGVRVFRAIIAAQRSKLDARTDRQLAKRTDALGALFARAPKKTRKAA